MQNIEYIQQTEVNIGKKNNWRKTAWGMLMACVLVLTLAPDLYIPVTWLMLPFIGILFFFDDFYALWGMFLFFEDNLVIISGVSLFAVYSMLVLIKFFIFDKCEKKIPVLILPALAVMLLYAMFAMPAADTTAARQGYIDSGCTPPSDTIINLRLIIGYILDTAVMVVLALRASGSDGIKRILLKTIVVTAIFSGVYGYISGNIFLYGGSGANIERYMASFNDPNYAGFFFNMAIFIVLCLEDFKKLRFKIPLLIVMYYFLIASGSMSGILFNAIGLVIFVICKYKYKAILGLAVLAVLTGAVTFAVMKVPKLRNLPIVVNMEERIVRQFVKTEETEGDMTSGRAVQWKNYWGYFKQQELEKKLFGGNMVMSYSVDQNLKDKFGNVPHQAYISFILDFGIVGASIMILFFLCKLCYTFIQMLYQKSDTSLIFFIISFMWLFYGFGFDYFGDWRFMIYYFL